MGAAVALGNVVGEAEHGLMIAVVPPQGTFDGERVALRSHDDGIADERRFGAVEIADEGLDAALIAHFDFLRLDPAPVGENDA